MTVLFDVALPLSGGTGVGLCLVGTQSLPLLGQAIPVPKVVLHVCLREHHSLALGHSVSPASPTILPPPPSGPRLVLTRIMCPVEMSMLAWAGSSHQDGVLLWELGLAWAASLNWEDTLLTREGSGGPSARLNRDLLAMCWRHRSCRGRIQRGARVA